MVILGLGEHMLQAQEAQTRTFCLSRWRV